MATLDEYTQKWNNFFDKGFAPWDTAAPASQLVAFVGSASVSARYSTPHLMATMYP